MRGTSLFGGDCRVAGPRGHRAYAVGDIHGCLGLLDELLARIEADDARRPSARTTVVFLGDLIDRGRESAQVVERLRLYQPAFAKAVYLAGNHEEVFLRVLGGDSALLSDWLQFGGSECVRSYDLDPAMLQRIDPDAAIDLLRDRVPSEHVEFLSSFADTVSFGGYVFVHAGVRPGVPLSEQVPEDLRWIRSPFLSDESDHGCVVVHGHTITSEVEVRANRIGIDTGAYQSGRLTALGIEGEDRWLIQTAPKASAERAARAAALSEAC